MARLQWLTKNPAYSYGVSHGVLDMINFNTITPWDGLTNASVTYGEPYTNEIYLNGAKVGEIVRGGETNVEISAYSFPYSFREALGIRDIFDGFAATQQIQQPFNFSYITETGDDKHVLHLFYNCKVSLSSVNYSTVSETITPSPRTYKISAIGDTRSDVPKPYVRIHESFQPLAYNDLVEIITGTEARDPRFPTMTDISYALRSRDV